jgi:hypothetical protein
MVIGYAHALRRGRCGRWDGRLRPRREAERGPGPHGLADASIMPTIPRVNTNLTTAGIAEKIAETI